ncbi:hypothetical protein BJ980_002143 [Nocardioides daedukensis]|uniref:Uncharacterized protein n=1 Tax=Nocardioides daedukensis TaxID=634462 RepID=A0A7Y9UVV8_9ACTN|nr:hypothetical protein [Nocardioides daedukensis]NYG59220.1 hypothetical protein [Nocardioides daedukensis]
MTTAPTTVLQARRAWSSLPTPDLASLEGRWEASFLAPLRTVAPRGLGLIGLPRWFGKQFTGDTGINLLHTTGGGLEETLPMRLGEDASWADRRPVAVVSYAADAPRPWRWIRDEVRILDTDTLLGMTFTDGPGVRRLGLPFLLRRS